MNVVHDRPIDWAVLAVEAAGALMILGGVAVAMLRIVRVPFMKQRPPLAALQVRLGLGLSLSLGLEFLLAADILRTAVSPTYEDIAQLAAIAAIRTALNFFIGRELLEGERMIAVLKAAPLNHGLTEAPAARRPMERRAPAPRGTAQEASDDQAAGAVPAARRRFREALQAALKGPVWIADTWRATSSSPTSQTTLDRDGRKGAPQ